MPKSVDTTHIIIDNVLILHRRGRSRYWQCRLQVNKKWQRKSTGETELEDAKEKPKAGKAVLLEAMPGAALKAMKLPHKGYKNGSNALKLRQEILGELEGRSGIKITNLSHFREHCLASHDALDSVVAAVIASLWARDPSVFWLPDVGGPDRVALLEGWLYAPVFI